MPFQSKEERPESRLVQSNQGQDTSCQVLGRALHVKRWQGQKLAQRAALTFCYHYEETHQAQLCKALASQIHHHAHEKEPAF